MSAHEPGLFAALHATQSTWLSDRTSRSIFIGRIRMRIVIAPDKFKDCLSAPAVADAIAAGLRRADPQVSLDLCPMADGGEGTVDALVRATGGRLVSHRVTGPLPEMKVEATFGILGDGMTAVIEMAAASGLHLLKPEDRNPLNTTTFGTGELLLAAAKLGVKRIILGIGGSATNDAGLGCAQAAGLPVVLESGEYAAATEPLTGHDIDSVVLVKHGRGSPIDGVEILVACDVSNPLFGANGAAAVFGPQKGATPEQVGELDDSVRRLAERLGKTELAQIAGAGAAGGLGFGMLAFFNATLRPGIEIVMEATRLRERLKSADLCFTGEGRLDASSLCGKTPIGVARLCGELGVPCVALAGAVEGDLASAPPEGLSAWFSICDKPMSLDRAMAEAPQLLGSTAEHVARVFVAGRLSRPANPEIMGNEPSLVLDYERPKKYREPPPLGPIAMAFARLCYQAGRSIRQVVVTTKPVANSAQDRDKCS
jgi:glycerate kinase